MPGTELQHFGRVDIVAARTLPLELFACANECVISIHWCLWDASEA